MRINFRRIEKKWQKRWEREKIFEANVEKKKKFFITFPYPYVNGSPHIGHSFSAFRVDSYARFKRMQGFNVLFPQGFHATGQPILGVIERLKQNDQIQIETFRLYGASDKDIQDFIKYGPEFVAKYWTKKWIKALKLAGFSIDWRRSFITAITPTYNRFIEWQYNTLRKKGYVVQGTHPVIWCPYCKSPTGDHDRLVGEGESPLEYLIIKFKLGSGRIIPCGTLRPETIYGVTNIWINPDLEYQWVKVNDEVWLLSSSAVEKLKDQLKRIKLVGKVKGSKLVGKYCENPVLKNKILILPAKFVDPNVGTGIVMSVPSHAPYDWIGLVELKNNLNVMKKYGVDVNLIRKIKPISIIATEGFGEHPAGEVCDKLEIKSQEEKEKLDKATDIVYKKEFHLGVLKRNCGKYSGCKVSEVKEVFSEELVSRGLADRMWEMTGPVICRCKTPCHVKILENQWFLKFSDKKWKGKVKKWIKRMTFYPEEVRTQFLNTIDWLRDKACARKSGLGTRLPWDREWIVETLSDSVIYMAYYTIAHIIKEKGISARQLTDEVFDFIFLGRGNAGKIARKSGIDLRVLKRMREEFEYFYPVDLRNSGKDLTQNHLVFYLFHHIAIWNNRRYWPRAISVNGFVKVGGEKMSKSKGNIRPLLDLIQKYGSDLVRINIVSSNEGLDDANWEEKNLQAFSSRLNFILSLIKGLKECKRRKMQNIDLFLRSKAQRHIEEATKHYEMLKFRSAVQSCFFSFINDMEWYVERCGGIKNCNREVLRDVLLTMIKLIAPVVPHLAEEFWEMMGCKGFVCTSKWPKSKKSLVNIKSELGEELIKQTLEDIREIQKIVKIKPEKVHIIVAPKWKFRVYKIVINNMDKSFSEIVKLIKKQEIQYAKQLFKRVSQLPKTFLSKRQQLVLFKSAKEFFEEKFKCKFVIEECEKSEIEKAKQAEVVKPAIYLE